MTKRSFDLRTFGVIACATLIGALWAGFNLIRTGDARDESVHRALIWIVFATPFAAYCGWAWVRPRERWSAAFRCFLVYFFAILLAARLERLVLGEERAEATLHRLYFQLTLLFDVLGCLGFALQRARAVGTIEAPSETNLEATPSHAGQGG